MRFKGGDVSTATPADTRLLGLVCCQVHADTPQPHLNRRAAGPGTAVEWLSVCVGLRAMVVLVQPWRAMPLSAVKEHRTHLQDTEHTAAHMCTECGAD